MGIEVFPVPAQASGLTRRDQITSTGTWTHPDGASSQNPKQAVVIALGADAEITRRYSKRYLLLVIAGRCEIATEIVNNLRDNTCPID